MSRNCNNNNNIIIKIHVIYLYYNFNVRLARMGNKTYKRVWIYLLQRGRLYVWNGLCRTGVFFVTWVSVAPHSKRLWMLTTAFKLHDILWATVNNVLYNNIYIIIYYKIQCIQVSYNTRLVFISKYSSAQWSWNTVCCDNYRALEDTSLPTQVHISKS